MRADFLEFKNKASEVETLVHTLSNPLKPSETSLNYFKQADVVGHTSDDTTVKNSVIANPNETSVIGASYRIKITQLAEKDKVTGSVDFVDKAAGLGFSGKLTINGTDVDITDGTSSTENMSLTDIANAINSAGIKVTAEVVSKTGTDGYYLTISSDEFAKPLTIADGGTSMMTLLGVSASGKTADQLSAKIVRDVNPDGTGGVILTRTQNDGIKDIIPGVVDLKSADANRVITLDFKDNKDGVKPTIFDLARKME